MKTNYQGFGRMLYAPAAKIAIVLCLLSVNQIVAQKFSVSAPISNIKSDGLHSLLLTPQIRSYTQSDFGDLRIFDAANKEVPYGCGYAVM